MDGALFNRRCAFGVVVQLQEQTAFLRAGHQQWFARLGSTLKLRRFTPAQGRVVSFNPVGSR